MGTNNNSETSGSAPIGVTEREELGNPVQSIAVKAGRRTYFFDVRATRAGEYYLTITENRRMSNEDGTSTYERHKIFLYKEDYGKFTDGLNEILEFIRKQQPIADEK